ncbi:MAG: hypothetical protein KDE31_08850, partial [Caldilineaceae bacterium]|nr:hypothetical protein [Caldilineaceae bacterium]
AKHWYTFQEYEMGWQIVDWGLAANYYRHSTIVVPNVTTMLLWLCAELADATGEQQYLNHAGAMVRFLQSSQQPNGELPYELSRRPHFMCYQYNAFELRDLAHYYMLTGDGAVWHPMQRLAAFLAGGVTPDGACRYSCRQRWPEVHYWTGVLAAALQQATALGLGDYRAQSARAHCHLLTQQRRDGGFDFSRRSYGRLRDRRSYPRYLAMILEQLLALDDMGRI